MYFFAITILLCIFAVSIRKKNSNMDSEIKRMVINRRMQVVAQLQTIEKMFYLYGEQIPEKRMNSLLDRKNELEKELKVLDKILEPPE